MELKRYSTFIITLLSILAIFSCSEDSDNNPVDPGPGTENDLNSGMVLIPAADASFDMGSLNGNSDEQPVHTVTFSFDFWMDTTEVTQGDYENLMSGTYTEYSTPDWHNPYGVGENYPAYAVTWGDAVLYCNARSQRDGLENVYSYTGISGSLGNGCELEGTSIDYSKDGYRLPTEAEWEFACRAGTTTDFFWEKNYIPYPETSADSVEINSYTVWCGNSWDFSSDDADYGNHPVAAKAPNAFGLYDMCGNGWEWVNDWYGSYDGSLQIDPTGPESVSYHFTRGGSWGNHVSFLRSSNRTFSTPDYYFNFLGFRVVHPVK